MSEADPPVPVIAVIPRTLMCYRHIQLGINQFAALHLRWHLTFCSPEDDYLEVITHIRPKGLILGPMRIANPAGAADAAEAAEAAVKRVGTVVGVNGQHRDYGLLGLPQVDIDDYEVGVVAATHFLQKGYRHFAYVDAIGASWAADRRRGFCEEVARAGHSVDVFKQVWTSTSVASDTAADDPATSLIDWLCSRPKPLGLLVCNDLRAREVLQTCKDKALHVPDEISVLGVDDDDLDCALSNPTLSSVSIPWRQMGYKAAELLHQRMTGHSIPSSVYRIPPTGVVERESTGAIAVDDPEVRRAVQFIRRNAHRPISVDDVVEAVDTITRRVLERRFRLLLGRTPLEEIRHAHFARAKMLLSGTDLPIDDVALASGFADPLWFSRAFRDVFGESPADYRRRNGGNADGNDLKPVNSTQKI